MHCHRSASREMILIQKVSVHLIAFAAAVVVAVAVVVVVVVVAEA